MDANGERLPFRASAMHANGRKEDSMQTSAMTSPRRAGTTAVHSLHRFVFSVPDLEKAADFYQAFGLDVRRVDGRIDLYTFGHLHRWGSIYRGGGTKRLEYVSFAAYPDDFEALVKRLGEGCVPPAEPHRLADEKGVWVTDPEGIAIRSEERRVGKECKGEGGRGDI